MIKKNILHTVLLDTAVFYVVSPVMIFLAGWIKRPVAVLCSVLCVYFMVRLMRGLSDSCSSRDMISSGSKTFWGVSGLILFLWVLFSGIGGFSYQTGDFAVRNPMFHDLLDHGWPVYFHMEAQPPLVRQVSGSGHMDVAAYVYYFAWWLPVAAFTKLFHLGRRFGDTALFLWAVLGVILTFYCLVRYLRKHSYWILAAFILFGGLDFVVYVFTRFEIPMQGHVEWWAGYFQYSAHTSQLYWVFNQSVPVWLILSLLLLMKERKQKIALCSLAFAYSPFAAVGMVPVAVASCLKNKGWQNIYQLFKETVSVENVGIPAMMLIVFGSFYMQNSNNLRQTGWIFDLYPQVRVFTVYLFFVITEVLIYFIIVGSAARRWQYYWVTLGELLLIPFYVAGEYNDFAMRGSIPAVFLMMVMVLRCLLCDSRKTDAVMRRRILAVVISMGFLTSVTELQRNISITLTSAESDYLNDPVVSFEKMQTDSEELIRLILDQYLPMDYKNSFFYRYLAER